MIYQAPPTILIADDNPTNLQVVIDYMSGQGYRVLVAEDGEGALEQARYGLPDLIMLDVNMPGMDGFEACRRLKESPETRDIPVIFMTANADTSYLLKGFAVGAVDYITKPLSRDEVNARVKSHVSIRRLQRELEAEIAAREQIEQELRVINSGKDAFFSILAHDLKNPMAGLLGLSEALIEMLPPDVDKEVRELATDLRLTTTQIAELLFDLLSWAQIRLGRAEPAPVTVDLRQTVEAAVALVAGSAHRKEIKLINLVLEPMEVFGDTKMLDTILRNILTNAVKFTSANGTIRIEAARKAGELVVTVADTGRGIPADRISGLFQLGGNKPSFGTKGEKGTGLGLPLCHDMVQRNGGRIWVDSGLGIGSKFHFTIPLAGHAD